MEVKITISDTQITSSTQGGLGPQSTSQTVSGVPASAADCAGATGMPEAYGMHSADMTAGPAMNLQTGENESAILPPPELLRAAAAMGASNAGPAPSFAAAVGGTAPGAPQPFLGAGGEAERMSMLNAPDQAAGAAPDADRMTPKDVITE